MLPGYGATGYSLGARRRASVPETRATIITGLPRNRVAELPAPRLK